MTGDVTEPWPTALATGVGSWPGRDPLEAQRTVLGELGSGGGAAATRAPFLTELPSRGPGADLVGRAASVLVGLPVDLQPSGWRFTDAPGRDQRRSEAYLRTDLDALAEVADGYTGPLKVQVAGPWTLAASVWLPRGERSVTDAGARRDVVASLAEGVAAHVADVRRLVPGAQVVLQLDEPSLPAVLAGRLPTISGFGRLPAVDAAELGTGLQEVLAGARDGGATATIVHCCARQVPFAVLRASGADAVCVDVTLLGDLDWESVAVAVEGGQRLWAGAVPTSGALPTVAEVVRRVSDPWRRVGLPRESLSAVSLTPACGLASSTPAQARAVLARTVEAADALVEHASGG